MKQALVFLLMADAAIVLTLLIIARLPIVTNPLPVPLPLPSESTTLTCLHLRPLTPELLQQLTQIFIILYWVILTVKNFLDFLNKR